MFPLADDGVVQLREDVATRQALELLVSEAKPISVEQAQAREALWTPGKEGAGGTQSEGKSAASTAQLWTPGS